MILEFLLPHLRHYLKIVNEDRIYVLNLFLVPFNDRLSILPSISTIVFCVSCVSKYKQEHNLCSILCYKIGVLVTDEQDLD